jgi:dipeptidase D
MSNEVLKGIEPASVFNYFEKISRIPRASGNEKAISDFLVSFAKGLELEVIQDSVNNIIIKKKGTAGYENAPIVIIQGHLDMVCEKNTGTVHDFEKDPIELVVDGDYISANGTTLGADNGIAVAYAMALLASTDIPHPPLEVLLTTDEETGMTGALGVNPDHIDGRILINIDSEEEGQLWVSCAGGLRTKVTLPADYEEFAGDICECIIKIRGLKGGHSGMDIDKQRGNSNRLMGRILLDALKKIDFKLESINGGAKNNAIPREGDAKLYIEASKVEELKAIIEEWNEIFKNEYLISDPGLKVELEIATVSHKVKVLKDDIKEKAIKLLYLIPNGIQSMSLDIKGLVQSSANLGIVTTTDEAIVYDSAVRSSIRSLKADISLQTELIGEANGAKVEEGAQYPEWQYDQNSKLRELFKEVYKDMYGKDAEIVAMHAGIECGLFKEKFGDIDMISFGPNMYDVHTPDEHLSISSTERTWEYLLAVLKKMK